MKEQNPQQFKFKAVGNKNGQELSKKLKVKSSTNKPTDALRLATDKARKWAYKNNLQNFYVCN